MHTGDDPSCTPLQLEQMAKAFPDVKVVLIHGGVRHLVWEAIEVAQRCPNVYIDQTAGTSWQLYRAMELLGPHRIMYGSDSPFMDTRVEQMRFRTAITDPHSLELAMGGTALSVYGLAG
jgi:predicted TIM-barrel fold metal-dependent hydrolase